MIGLPELLELIARRWPDKYERGRILHIHQNEVQTSAGLVHLRVMVQLVPERTSSAYLEDKLGAKHDVDLR